GEGSREPDRDAQFEYSNARVKTFLAQGHPAGSVDTKKKELVGDFKNVGRELRPKGQPEPVRVHDFAIPELGKVAPYGVYDMAANAGWINLGIDHDTAAFAVESLRRWWQELGKARYPDATRLLVTADCGGSNGALACGNANCSVSPTKPGSPSPSPICRPAPANGTRLSIASLPSSPKTGAASPSSTCRSSSS